MDETMQQIYPYFIQFHILFSVLFLVLALVVSIHAGFMWIKGGNYNALAKVLRKVFLSLLYFDLLLGFVLYFFLQKPAELIHPEDAMKFSNLRFWAVQHFSNIIFVVILSAVGNLLIVRTVSEVKKYKYSFFYFGISTLIIIISVSLFALRK